jgi:putative ABC transport system substrate-binding protein
MKRRTFIAGLGSAAAWPVVARAQQPVMPVIGYLGLGAQSADDEYRAVSVPFLRGLKETGYVEGQNVTIAYRYAENQFDRLPALAADLVRRRVAVIAAGATPAALAAKAATTTIPIVFATGADPVATGLVASLNRPGGNLTGTSIISVEMIAKRLELLHELLPTAKSVALLVNPTNAAATDAETKEIRIATSALGLRLMVLNASTPNEIEAAFATAFPEHIGALVVAGDAFFYGQRDQLASLAARHAVPAIYPYRAQTAAGGLMSYGPDIPDIYRLFGVYTGKILNGAKPADLPVQQPTKFELVINLKTAKALGLTIPETLLATADEVIQ